jgi:hypothetical protein
MTGSGNPQFGKVLPKESLIKMGLAHKKSVIQYDLEGNFIQEWDSAQDVKINLKIDKGDIGKCCKGKNKTAGGFKWKYKIKE